MTTTNIKIIRGQYKNKGIVYMVDFWNNGKYYGAWIFDNMNEVCKFIKECNKTKFGLPKGTLEVAEE